MVDLTSHARTNTGFGVDVCAPGFWVSSAYSFGGSGSAPNKCYIVQMAGTSMATPQLAGATALLREYFTSGCVDDR